MTWQSAQAEEDKEGEAHLRYKTINKVTVAAGEDKGVAVDDMTVQPKQTKTKKKKPIYNKMLD